MSEDELNKKIEKIDLLLENYNEFDKYINDICIKDIKIPNNLNQNIMLKLNKKHCSVIRFTNILKIVACTVFTLFIWLEVISNEAIDSKLDSINMKIDLVNITSITEKISSKMSGISDFFLAPLEVKKGDNK